MPPHKTLYKGIALGVWVGRQRKTKKQGTITPEHNAALEAIPGCVVMVGRPSPLADGDGFRRHAKHTCDDTYTRHHCQWVNKMLL